MRVRLGPFRFKNLSESAEALVHPAARRDGLAAARHRAFIASRLAAGLVVLCAFPVALAMQGPPTAAQAVAWGWLVAPIASAFHLSRTGRLAEAHFVSAASLVGLVAYVAALTNGPSSFALPWLVVAPLEAALSGSRPVIVATVALALAALGALFGLQDWLPATGPSAFTAAPLALSLAAALLYAGGLALAIEAAHRESEEAARSRDERYRLLADHVSDMVTRHRTGGAVIFASPAAERLLGLAPAALMDDGLFGRVHVGDRPAYLTALAAALSDRRPSEVEFRARAERPGERAAYVWLEMRCRPVPGMPGEAIAITRDVTERKRHEAELNTAREEAERASEAKSRFLANVSHELRTPLNVIIGFSEVLTEEALVKLDGERRREYARLIHESGTHLLQMVNDILDMSKIEMGAFMITPEPFALAPLLENCRQMMQNQAMKAGVALSAEVEDGVPELVADKRACRQILLNLLSNAIKFTEPGGTVRVAARRDRASLLLVVEDTGIGIAPQDLPRLGTPFAQADSAYGRRFDGAGLGLSVVKGLVQLHGGELGIESELGKGTRITVRLPLDRAEKRPLRRSA